MRLPRFTATTTARGTTGVRVDPAAMTQEARALGDVGKAIGDVSDTMFKIEDRRLELDANLQFGKVTQNASVFLSEQQSRIDQTEVTSPKQKQQLLSEARKEFDGFLSDQLKSVDNPRAKRRLDEWKGNQDVRLFDSVRRAADKKLNDYQTGEYLQLAVSAARAGDTGTANSYIDVMDENELITHERAVGLKQKYAIVAQESIEKQAESEFQSMVVAEANLPGKTWDDAIEWASSPEAVKMVTDAGIDIEKARTIVSSVVSFANSQKRLEDAEAQKQVKLSNEKRDQVIADGYTQIATNPEQYDLRASTLAVMSDDSMSNEDRIKAVDNLEQQYTQWHKSDAVAPDISDSDSQGVMEKASSDLANRRITKQEYYEIFAQNKTTLDETDRRRFVKEGETSYAAGVNAIKTAYQSRARNQIVTLTKDKMEAMLRDVDRGIKMTYMLDSAGAKQQAQQLIYNDYVQDVLDLFEREGYGEKPQKEIEADIRSIYARHSTKSWMDIYESLSAQNQNFRNMTKSVADEYGKYMKQLHGVDSAWDKTDSVQKAKIVDLASQGKTMKTILRMAEEGQF